MSQKNPVDTQIAQTMNVDLHCHSYYSDGKHSPDFLIQRARENQISHLAITDHDCSLAFEQYKHLATDITGLTLTSRTAFPQPSLGT